MHGTTVRLIFANTLISWFHSIRFFVKTKAVADDARTAEHRHAKNDVMQRSVPKCEPIKNAMTVITTGFVVVLNIRKTPIDPNITNYEPDNQK